jgi:hypothetical protein
MNDPMLWYWTGQLTNRLLVQVIFMHFLLMWNRTRQFTDGMCSVLSVVFLVPGRLDGSIFLVRILSALSVAQAFVDQGGCYRKCECRADAYARFCANTELGLECMD